MEMSNEGFLPYLFRCATVPNGLAILVQVAESPLTKWQNASFRECALVVSEQSLIGLQSSAADA
jgi:hypothetical protein